MRGMRDEQRGRLGERQASRNTVLTIALLVAGLAVSIAHAAPQTALPAPPVAAPAPNNATFRIMGSREGLVGSVTASGHRILPNDYFVALPSGTALGKKVRLTYKGKSLTLPVKDVGPYNTKDDYWNPPEIRYFKGLPQGVPQAHLAYKEGHNGGMSGIGIKVAFPLGIDIGDGAFYELGMRDSDYVDVTFLWLLGDDGEGDDDDAPAPAPGLKTSDVTATTTSTRTPTVAAATNATQAARPSAAAPSAAAPSAAASAATTPVAPKTTATPTPKRTGVFDPKTLPLLNTSTRPPLDAAAPLGGDFTYVDETKHNIPAPIARYWKAKGGVSTFGFPLSEVFLRLTADGERHVYQYFERVLMEYLPGSDSVALAPLGSWFAEDDGPYKTVAPFESGDTKRYVKATQHGISGAILKHYAANGDADFFGDPLNEAVEFKTSDGRTVTAQLFENGRIEVDKDGKVTLGRLGAEWLKQRGWG